jgi:hypothetical protein
MDIHPELAKLRQEYERITSDFEHGHIQEDEAKSALGNLWVFDDTGAAWGIDLYGRFVRQASPHAEVIPASPHSFGTHLEDGSTTKTVIDGQEWVIPENMPASSETGMRELHRHKKTIKERFESIPIGDRTKGLIQNNRSTLIVIAVLFFIFMGVKLAGDNATPLNTETTQAAQGVTTVTQERLNEILQSLLDPNLTQSVVVEQVTPELATEISNKLSALSMTGTLNAAEGGVVVVSPEGNVTAQLAWSLVLENGVWRLERVSTLFNQ